jgi:hypothetical protein
MQNPIGAVKSDSKSLTRRHVYPCLPLTPIYVVQRLLRPVQVQLLRSVVGATKSGSDKRVLVFG